MTFKYEIGDHVRISDRLEADWHGGRAADGAASVPDTGWGRITHQWSNGGYCGTCEYDDTDCPGPFYGVDSAAGDSVFHGGTVYAEHELISAQEILIRQLDADLSMQGALW